MENLAEHVALGTPDDHENFLNDEWSKLREYCAIVGSDQSRVITPEKVQEHIGIMLTRDAEHNAEVRARVARVVKDKGTAEKLTPWYPTWCKRPTFSDIYLDTYNTENVHLVDTSGKGVESVTAKVLWRMGKNIPSVF
ncbi:hypothetical protein AB5N19_06210 [Seiridium cardinale]